MNRSIKQLIAIVCASICASSVHAAQLQVRLGAGSDSNPLRLADKHGPDNQAYIYSGVRFKTDKDSLLLIDASQYKWSFIDNDDADQTLSSVTLGLQGKALDKDLSYVVKLNLREFDKTYVSRFSGDVYELKDVLLEDRYDLSRNTYSASLRYRLNKSWRVTYQGHVRQADYQDYEEYADLGLTELDYDEYYNSFGVGYRLNKDTYIETSGEHKFRIYEQKLAKGLDGRFIDGRELEYNYIGANASLRHKLSKQLRLSLSAKWVAKSDNGGGYYDTEYKMARVALRYKTDRDHVWSVSGTLQDLSYERQSLGRDEEDLASNDEFPDSQGGVFKLGYTAPVFDNSLVDGEVYANLSTYQYDSSTPEFRYDRTKLEAGIRLTFDW